MSVTTTPEPRSPYVVAQWQRHGLYWLAYNFPEDDGSWTEYHVNNETGDENELIALAIQKRSEEP